MGVGDWVVERRSASGEAPWSSCCSRCADPLSLEEVAESLVPPPLPAAATGGDMVAEQEVVEQERAVDSAEAQILVARVATAADRRELTPNVEVVNWEDESPGAWME